MRWLVLFVFPCLSAFSFEIHCNAIGDSELELPSYLIKSVEQPHHSLTVTRIDGKEKLEVNVLEGSKLTRQKPVVNGSRFGMGGFVFLQPLQSGTESVGYLLVDAEYRLGVHVKSEFKIKMPRPDEKGLSTEDDSLKFQCALKK